jgi:hypothetical protein
MAEQVDGPNMVLSWIWSGGTTSLAADYRNVTWSPSVAYAETTAGSDTHVGRLTTIKDANASVELVNPSAGTALYAALAPGMSGTLIIGPEGTATNKRKITFVCFSDGAQYPYPYADVATVTCGFTGNGAFTDGVY